MCGVVDWDGVGVGCDENVFDVTTEVVVDSEGESVTVDGCDLVLCDRVVEGFCVAVDVVVGREGVGVWGDIEEAEEVTSLLVRVRDDVRGDELVGGSDTDRCRCCNRLSMRLGYQGSAHNRTPVTPCGHYTVGYSFCCCRCGWMYVCCRWQGGRPRGHYSKRQKETSKCFLKH